ncbi:MAG: penicillin-binding protein 1C [Gammaproteobacteria bacterium SHHR-1]
MRTIRLIPLLLALAGLGLLLASAPPLPLEPLAYSTEVVDRQGRPLRRFLSDDGYWRLPVELERLDPAFINNLLSIEDKRFYRHHGVDPLALLRAGWQWLSQGSIVSGGSTLSMQTVRLLHPRPRSLVNKLRQIGLAWRLEQGLSKTQILRLYLELTPYGGNIQGVQAASLIYFGKPPWRLTPSEQALLIALPQSPERRRPDRHRQAAQAARDRILQRLQQAGRLSPAQADTARRQPIPTARQPSPTLAAHLSERLQRRHARQQRIKTSLDAPLQANLERLARRVQAGLEAGATLALVLVENASGKVLAQIGSGDYWSVGQWDMSRALRSPGSTLKPFIYGLGFERGLMHPETRFIDQPLRAADYAPENFNAGYSGLVSLRSALQGSLNTAAVAALQRIGPETLRQRLAGLGISLHLAQTAPAGLAIALGGVGMRLQDLVALYAALANQGRYRPLSSLLKEPPPAPSRLLSETAAWYLDDILRQTPPPKGYRRQRPIRFKTGTSYGYRDAWALGYSPRFTLGVWLGRPDNGYGKGLSGMGDAAPLLFEVFDRLPTDSSHGAATAADRPAPPGVLRLSHAHLPPSLQWLGPRPEPGTGAPRIHSPPDGASLRQGPSPGSTARPLLIQVQGGSAPCHWLINGLPLQIGGNDKPGQCQPLHWLPDQRGQVRIQVIDAKGRGDQIGIWLSAEGEE